MGCCGPAQPPADDILTRVQKLTKRIHFLLHSCRGFLHALSVTIKNGKSFPCHNVSFSFLRNYGGGRFRNATVEIVPTLFWTATSASSHQRNTSVDL